MQINGIVLSNPMFVKIGDNEFKSVNPDEDISIKLHKHNGMLSLGYIFDGNEHKMLYRREEADGKMLDASPMKYTLCTKLVCTRTAREVWYYFNDDFKIRGYKPHGDIETTVYELLDADYDCTIDGLCNVSVKLPFSMEEFGYPTAEDAEFFNEYTVDGVKHAAQADKIIPAKLKIRTGMAAITKMLETFEKNGLVLVYDESNCRIGLMNKLDKKDYAMGDKSDGTFVPDWIAIPYYPKTLLIPIANDWGIILNN